MADGKFRYAGEDAPGEAAVGGVLAVGHDWGCAGWGWGREVVVEGRVRSG